MCYYTKQAIAAEILEAQFKANFVEKASYKPNDQFNGFAFPQTPVITNQDGNTIQLFNWGLLPFWAKDSSFRKNTLNAKIETLSEKPSFRSSLDQRCLVLVDGFYEWKWLDDKGKTKQKYLITMPDAQPFALAGLWSVWTNKISGEVINTYTIVTTQANELMSEIHNTKKRMPMVLTAEEEQIWLANYEVSPIREVDLKASEM
jgi:putative SOS response-associated peptidase YedK